ncbi:MAG: hypothetical protein OEM21_00675 [Nitrosopumilus sp.]|nr:hypothetical protein [Nitrosopumilus sp.]
MKVFWISTLIISFLFLGTFSTAFAGVPVTYSTVANGDWNDGAIWRHDDGVGNQIPGVPGSADTKFVNNAVTISSPVSNSGLIQVTGSLTISSTITNTGFFDGITTNGLVNFGTVTVANGGTYQNSGLFDNIGGAILTINTGGNFNNLGTANTHFHNEQATVNVIGTLTNQADIHQLTNGVMDVSGTLANTGAAFAVFDNRFGAELRTSSLGTINNSAGGIIDNAGTLNNNLGSVNNSAVINNKIGTGVINNNVGTFKINSGGTLNNEASSNLNNDGLGTVDNSGTVINIGNVNNSGVLENENIFNNTSTGIIDNTKTVTNKVGGTLNNEGTLDNHDKFDNDGTVDNKEDATITNFAGGKITNNLVFQNDGKIINSDTITNTGTFTNDNYVENEKQIDNTSGTINNTCLINSSGNVPNTGGKLNNQNTITNNGAMVFQPGGKFTNTGTLNGNLEANILENEIIPEEDKIKGRIVVSTPDRHSKPTDKVGQLPLKGVKMTFTHSGGPVLQDSDRTIGDFSFDVPTKKDTVSLETELKDGPSTGFPNGLLEVHNAVRGTAVKFKTEDFNSCIRIAFLELNATNPELRVSGEPSTPTLTGLPQVSRLAHLAATYYYFLIGLDFTNEHLTALTLDSSLPLDVIGFSNDANTNTSASHFNPNGDPALHLRGPTHTDTGKSGSTLADDKHTEYKIDTVFHELGHYLVYESKIGGENSGIATNRNAHPDLSAVEPGPTGCHSGYAQLDSSCAWSEGFATFLSAAISKEKLTDTKHSEFPAKLHHSLGGGKDIDNGIWNINGFIYPNGTSTHKGSYEEYAAASLVWDILGITTMDNLFTILSNQALNPGNPEIITTLSDLHTVVSNSGIVTQASWDGVYGNHKICVDSNNSTTCDAGDTFGVSEWGDVRKKVNGTSYPFGYPHPGNGTSRTEEIPELPSLVSFDVEDLTGTTIMDGTKVMVETVLSGGEKYSHQETIYDGKLISDFNIPYGAHINLIFTNEEFFSESITIDALQYENGFGNDDQMNSLAFTVSLTPKDPCTPPISGVWIISSSCELTADAIITGNVTVTNNSQVEIPSGITLTITSGNNLTVESGSGLKIISGGTLQINS